MQIAVACDHAGFPLKDEVIAALEAAGCSTIDLGTYDQEPVDYPDYAEKAGRAIINGQAERAVLVCGSGIGACIAANKMKGIYACNVNDVYSARQGVEHAKELVTAFVGAHFSAEERHQRRFGKILKLEANGKKE